MPNMKITLNKLFFKIKNFLMSMEAISNLKQKQEIIKTMRRYAVN